VAKRSGPIRSGKGGGVVGGKKGSKEFGLKQKQAEMKRPGFGHIGKVLPKRLRGKKESLKAERGRLQNIPLFVRMRGTSGKPFKRGGLQGCLLGAGERFKQQV